MGATLPTLLRAVHPAGTIAIAMADFRQLRVFSLFVFKWGEYKNRLEREGFLNIFLKFLMPMSMSMSMSLPTSFLLSCAYLPVCTYLYCKLKV